MLIGSKLSAKNPVMTNWYLIQYKANSYKIAVRNLNQQGFRTFLPMQDTTNRNKSKFLATLKPLFPGYMFININSFDTSWSKINNTLGVKRIVCDNDNPKPLPLELVMGIMSRCDEFGKMLPRKQFIIGDSVQFLSGAFTKFLATVEEIDSDERIWVMMDFMGYPRRVQVASDNLI